MEIQTVYELKVVPTSCCTSPRKPRRHCVKRGKVYCASVSNRAMKTGKRCSSSYKKVRCTNAPSLVAHDFQVASAVFFPPTGALVVSGRDGTLRVFRILSRRLPPAPVPHGTTAEKATQVRTEMKREKRLMTRRRGSWGTFRR